MNDTQTICERIASNPNPAAGSPLRRFITWGRKWAHRFHSVAPWGRDMDRDAAIDSARNVLTVIGASTVLADFGTMRLWMAVPCAAVAGAVWYFDYLRHF